MSEVKWTSKQREVIELRDCNILVSAAAGSGKTAVLVERILSRIMDPINPVDVDRFVIVTFTKAAAAGMRERIGKAIDRAVAENPANKHIQQQTALLHNAKICTIHSFCGYVIQNYFHRIGVDPAYRLGSEAEMSMLQADILKGLLEECYEQAEEDFISLADCYMFDKNDSRMEAFILSIYQHAISEPWPGQWFQRTEENLAMLSGEAFETAPLTVSFLTYCHKVCQDMLAILDDAMNVCNGPGGPDMYVPMLVSDYEQIEQLTGVNTFDELAEGFSKISFVALSRKKSEETDPEIRTYVKNRRDFVKNTCKSLVKDFFFQDGKRHQHDHLIMKEKLVTLLHLAETFMKRYQEEKREKGLADFNDLEQLAIEILLHQDEAGQVERTEAAIELSRQFEEIMIDEYQDSNLVQDTILKSISRECEDVPNIFMVGDVKQSIYRFRLARPELFIEKLNAYSKTDGDYRRVDLHKNFRSRGLVLDTVNDIFKPIMKPDLGGIDYDEEAALYVGAQFPETEQLTASTIDALIVTENDPGNELEAAMIASKIKGMVDDKTGLWIWDEDTYRPARYEDIVILVRSAKGYVEPLENALRAKGIPTNSDKKEGFYQTEEIRMMIRMFQIIDNPRQDIPLASILSGPMFSFSDEELALIKGEQSGRDFYEYLICYNGADEIITAKIKGFLTILDELREKMSYEKVVDIIHDIFRLTDFHDYVLTMPEAQRRQANMDLLMKQAIDFDQTSYHGLSQFVRYLGHIENNQMEAGEASISGENENVVRIVTIHKSKGLEYPICILAGMGRKLGGRTDWLQFHPELGIASEYIDNEKRLRHNTFARNYLVKANHLEEMGEELRVLYVAMTRAKEKLVFTCSVPKWDDKVSLWSAGNAHFLDRVNAGSYLDYIMPVLLNRLDERLEISTFTEVELVHEEAETRVDNIVSKAMLYNFDTAKCYDRETKELIDFMEHYEYEIKEHDIPVKVSVSDLKKKSIEEESSPEFTFFSTGDMAEDAPQPRFAQDKEETVRGGALYGTIWHQVMAVIDFSSIKKLEDITKEVAKLLERGKINRGDEVVLDEKKLYQFFTSSLGQRMTAAMQRGTLYREQPFVLGVAAEEILPDQDSDEMVLVQGIIDAFFEEDGDLVLMDYKTDSLKEGQEEVLIGRYKTQIDFYKRALESITGKRVKESILYSFSLQQEISV